MKKGGTIALVAALAGSGSSPVTAAGGPNQRGLSGWLPYYGNQPDRRASFIENASADWMRITVASPVSNCWFFGGIVAGASAVVTTRASSALGSPLDTSSE